MTSLAAQLQRLATPATSTYVESKKRHSILYDNNEAADVDNKTIFDLSKSALDELILKNSQFRQFQNTLFDESAINLERSVETSDTNETLNKNIKKFLFHLSPHFLVREAHQCLEWLIRRYRINEYNVDDMMALILPFHETMMFVKCLQTIPLKHHRNRWHWLKVFQKSGERLPKPTIMNRAANDAAFLKFISDTTLAAVNEVQSGASASNALFAFYSTVTLGALDAANEITESHISNITSTISKGLSSDIVDFRAGAMMIVAFFMTKLQFQDKFLNRIVDKLSINLSRPELTRESTLLLIVICQTQTESKEMVAEAFLSRSINNSSITTALGGLGELYKANVDVMPFCLPLITSCLKNIEGKQPERAYHKFVELLLSELTLNNKDADAAIRCILNALKTPKPQSDVVDKTQSDIIDLSEDGDVDMVDDNAKDSQLHSKLMRIIETRYPEVFDAVKTDIMSSQDLCLNVCMIVIADLLCSSYNAVDLYHSHALNRMEAVKNLVKLSTMSVSDDKKNFLVAGIVQCLSDSSPAVVNEVLKFNTEDLIKIVGEQNLIKKLKCVMGDQFMTQKEWQEPIGAAIKHITSKQLLSNDNEIEIFLAIWPYMFPFNDIISHRTKIVKSGIATRFPIIQRLQDVKDRNNLMECVNKQLNKSFEASKIIEIVQFVKTIPDAEMTTMSAFHIINLLTHSLPKNCDHCLSTGVYEILTKFAHRYEMKSVDIDRYAQDLYSRIMLEKLPIQLLVNCMQSIIKRTNFSALFQSNVIDFTVSSAELMLMLNLHRHLCKGIFSQSKRTNSLYNKAMSEFIRLLLPNIDKQLDFYSNFFISHYFDQLAPNSSLCIGPESQLLSMRLFNELLKRSDGLNELKMEVFVRIISGLTSPLEAVRMLTCVTIDELYDKLAQSSQYSKLLGSLLKERANFAMCPEELSSFLFHNKQKRAELFEFIGRRDSTMILKAALMDMLKLVNDNKEHLEIAVDVALDILHKTDSAQPIILNPHESIVVYQAIIRFNPKTISSITRAGNCKIFFEKVLQQSNVFVQIDSKVQSISVEAMNLNIFANSNKFFTNSTQQKFLINSIVKSATFSQHNDVRSRANSFFQKSIELDGKIELDILTEMAKVTSIDVARKEQLKCLSQELLQTTEWKCGVTLLEFLTKKRLTNPLSLMRQLFPILQKCLCFDDQSMVEYTKQLVLLGILNCCELMSPTGPFLESDFKVDLIVQCVRGTQNPQTHHHALQLLTKLSKMVPDSVLHNIMEIFTFIGDSVVKRDDAYIYQLISNIVKSVVPILQQKNIVQVLKVFGDIISDVPTHRRSALYEDLLNTLGLKKCLWRFLACLFETEVRKAGVGKTEVRKNSKSVKSVIKSYVAIEITNLFNCDVIIETCYQLIKFTQEQLSAIDKRTAISDDSKSIFHAAQHSKEHCVQYINLILNFVNILTKDSSEFSTKMASLDQPSLLKHKETFKNIIPRILEYIKASSQSSLRKVEKWNDALSACYHILDHLLDLLYPDMLLQVVGALLSEENEVDVRGKIIDLLNKKLGSPELFTGCKDSILSLLDPLTKIVQTITESPANSSLQKDALVAIKLLSRIIAKDHPNEFADVLKTLAKILQNSEEISILLHTRLIECLGELCANLRVHAVSHLYRFMPAITDVLNDLIERRNDFSPCFVIILEAIGRIVETLAQFLTPYLVNLIKSLSILWSRLQQTSSTQSEKCLEKLDGIWKKLSSSLELRVLIPMVEAHIYPDLLIQEEFNATGALMVLLSESMKHSENANLAQNYQDLTTFFIGVMDFRSQFHRKCATVDEQEDFFIKTLIDYVLKLSEQSFRPFFLKFYEWSNENVEQSFDRAITFYRFTNRIAESLKSLFISFAQPIVQNTADLLKRNFTKAQIKASSAHSTTLIYNILSTLQTTFLHGNSFINSHRFNVLLEPIVDVLDNEVYLMDKNIIEILPKCLAQFAIAANNDLLWKQLNHQILMKTRSNSVVVRRLALVCSTKVLVELGEDSLQLYPELIPFFSELLEDEDSEIQKLCNRSITEIEKVTGEDLKKSL